MNEKVIIFDMDGVLVDSEPVIEEASRLGLLEYGVKAMPEDFIPFVGAGENKYIGGVSEKYGVPFKPEMKKRVYEIYLEIVSSKLKLYKGIPDLLKLLKSKGFIITLASSADKIKINANLEVAKIDEKLFSVILSGDDVHNKKPDPEIFLKTAEKLGVIPENCIVIEDAVNGIKAAKSAGMKCIAVTTSFSKEILKNENPDYICDKTVEITNVLFYH